MAEGPLRPRQDRVVVGEDRAAGALAEELAVDRRGAADEAVGGGPGDQVVDRAPPALGGDRVAAVLDEAALVDQVGEVLARRPPARRVTLLDRIGPRPVLGQRPPRSQLGEVGALGRRAAGGAPGPVRAAAGHLSLFSAALR